MVIEYLKRYSSERGISQGCGYHLAFVVAMVEIRSQESSADDRFRAITCLIFLQNLRKEVGIRGISPPNTAFFTVKYSINLIYFSDYFMKFVR